jgi:SAM-dependent methyltransferase
LKHVDVNSSPVLAPYQGLAEVWHEHSTFHQPNYAEYLKIVAGRLGNPLRTVLDLACGTGHQCIRLSEIVETVVGLDLSTEMLVECRRRTADRPKVSLRHGRFSDFQLGTTFDAVVCASNSLNYVTDDAELAAVFRCVSDHLNPGGLFVFDVIGSNRRLLRNNQYMHSDVRGSRFVVRFTFEAHSRHETSYVMFPNGVEVHRRLSIDPSDVIHATSGRNLHLLDRFSRVFFSREALARFYGFYAFVKS